MPKAAIQLIYKCDDPCPYFDRWCKIEYCTHPFNEYDILDSRNEGFPKDCPLEDIEKICYRKL